MPSFGGGRVSAPEAREPMRNAARSSRTHELVWPVGFDAEDFDTIGDGR